MRASKLFKLKTAANHAHHKRHAVKILDTIDVYVKKAIESFENLASVGKERETIALLTESNAFANDLEAQVYNLTQIAIKTFKSGHSSTDVVKVAKNFSSHVYSLQKTFNVDINELKQELKLGLQGVSVEARKLYGLFETEPTYGSRLLTIIDDLLVVVKKVNFRNIIETKTPEELKNIEENLRNTFINGADHISDKVDDASLNMIYRYLYHTICHMGPIVRTLDEDADGYDDKVKSSLEEIAFNISEHLAVLDNALRTKDDPATIRAHLELIGRSCYNEMVLLIDLDNPHSPNEKISVNLKNLILLILSHHLSLGDQLIA